LKEVARMGERKSRLVGLRIELHGGDGHWVEHGRWNHVTWEESPNGIAARVPCDAEGIVDLNQPAAGVQRLRGIAISLKQCGQRRGGGALRSRLRALGVEEEEGLVAAVVEVRDEDGTAGGAAELVAPRGDNGSSGAIREEGVRVQCAVAEEVERTAMDLVRSR